MKPVKSAGLRSHSSKLSFEQASELGRALSNGGIALSDDETAFKKRCGR